MNRIAGLVISLLLILCIVLVFRAVFVPSGFTVDSGCREVMGTLARVVAVAPSRAQASDAIEKAFEKLVCVDNVMSDYKADSELSRVNRNAFFAAVPVCEDLFEVLETALEYSRRTDGAFDVTIGPVVRLWRDAEKTGHTPSTEQIAGAKAKVGYQKLLLDKQNRTVRFAAEGMLLDLGAIAKGYAIDLAVSAAKKAGATGVMVDVGGDIGCAGKPAGNDYWIIGLQDPGKEQGILMKLKLTGQAAATSGDYRRFVVVDSVKHSHIFNPTSADSARDFCSVTVIAPRAIDADALATSVTVLGKQKGLKLIEDTPAAQAIIIPSPPVSGNAALLSPAGDFIFSSGAKLFIQK